MALWTASALLATTPLRAGESSRRLELALVNVARVSPLTIRVLEHEARSILGEGGAGIHWGDEDGDSLRQGEIPVILVEGDHPHRPAPAAILGAVDPAAPGPAVWIYSRAVARVAGLRWPPEVEGLAEQRALGLALGRVAVHEVVHIVCPERDHALDGLMAARVVRRDLVGPRPGVELPPPARWRLFTRKRGAPGRLELQKGRRCLLTSEGAVRRHGGGS